ncbi:hypothetical protein OC834_006413 [Tilletia horrida]|uniref:Uncharacterized protein n=1 Tax=Tilletia horrida TaxID=155126 RepID=A0AAN6GBK9_9BASI|nr:hypothetical protein OC834_006413 [Tilletia horrida]KAK0531732.1 hypothetical protein OC842_003516 [Tilletia horrida]KAK0548202.1 hypothetical protein OC844_007050 [Tilletia horrida]
MTAYPEFKLLPVPPPTWLSTSSPKRAQLPRFGSVAEAIDFAQGLVLARYNPVVERFLWFVIIYIGLLVALALSVIARRLLASNFWIFRLVRRPDGLLICPHLHNCWSLMAGCFGLISTIYNMVTLDFIRARRAPMHVCITLIYVWSPLYLGVSWMAWAAAVAGTQDLVLRIKLTDKIRCNVRLAPWVANLIGLALPFSCTVAVFFPSRAANSHSEHARHMYEDWMHQYRSQQQLSEEMLRHLQQIWFEVLKASYSLAIAALLWSVFASITLAIYLFFSMRLIRTLRKHLKKRGGKSEPLQNAMTISMGLYCHTENEDEEDEPELDIGHTPSHDLYEHGDQLSAIASSEAQYPQMPERARTKPPTLGQRRRTLSKLTPKPKPELRPRPKSKPQAVPDSARPKGVASGPGLLAKEGANSVGRAVLYFAVQAGSINTALAIMDSIAFTLAIKIVQAAEVGRFEELVILTWSILEMTCVVFGTTTLCSIAHETFEESIASLIHPSVPSHTSNSRRCPPEPLQLNRMTISVLERRRRLPQQSHIETEIEPTEEPSVSTTNELEYHDTKQASASATTFQTEKGMMEQD